MHPPKKTSSLSTWLYYLEHLHVDEIHLGLDRIKFVAEKLDLLKPPQFIFTVSGTNGKGTTCHMLETLLIASGYRVGVYSSPHLLRYTERVRIQGKELDEKLHSSSFALIEASRGNILLTYFEYGTLAALNLFRDAKLEIIILEVGLGGRLDATNIIDSDIAIITSISYDHTSWLGCDRNSIANEKAGIFRAGKPAVIGEPDILEVLNNIALEKNVQLLQCNRDWKWYQKDNLWMLEDSLGQLCGLPLPQIPLANAATALVALRISNLKLNQDIIYKYLPSIRLPGRFQTINHSPRVILDVAHNPHAAHYVASRLANEVKIGKVHAIVGILYDKDISGILAALSPQVDFWYCTTLNVKRGTLAQDLMIHLKHCKAFKNISNAWKSARKHAGVKDTILVCGSFHTVAQFMKLVRI